MQNRDSIRGLVYYNIKEVKIYDNNKINSGKEN